MIAPLILFNVKVDENFENISQAVPQSSRENEQKNMEIDSAGHKENKNMESLLELFKKKLEGNKDERNINEWQAIAKVLDRLLFIVNVISFIIAFGYGYTTLYTLR